MRAWSLIMPYLCNAEATSLQHDCSNELIRMQILFGLFDKHANKKSLRISRAGFS
jgi:hypothetical protein